MLGVNNRTNHPGLSSMVHLDELLSPWEDESSDVHLEIRVPGAGGFVDLRAGRGKRSPEDILSSPKRRLESSEDMSTVQSRLVAQSGPPRGLPPPVE